MTVNNCQADIMAVLPLCQPHALIGNRHVLVVAPHPDDETLGCGGLLAWAASTNRCPRVLFLTDGEGSHPGSARFPPNRLAQVRRAEALNACKELGISATAVTFLGLPDAGLESLEDAQRQSVIVAIRDWVAASSFAAVCVTADMDAHGDHIAAHQLVKESLSGLHGYRFFTYPVWSWVTPSARGRLYYGGWRVDVSPFSEIKQAAISRHASQLGRVVTDTKDAFVLPPELLRTAQQGYEVLFDAGF